MNELQQVRKLIADIDGRIEDIDEHIGSARLRVRDALLDEKRELLHYKSNLQYAEAELEQTGKTSIPIVPPEIPTAMEQMRAGKLPIIAAAAVVLALAAGAWLVLPRLGLLPGGNGGAAAQQEAPAEVPEEAVQAPEEESAEAEAPAEPETPEEPPAEAAVEEVPEGPQIVEVFEVTANSLAVRVGPSTDVDIITYVEYGTQLEATDVTSYVNWIEILWEGKPAYVNRGYVKSITPPTTITEL